MTRRMLMMQASEDRFCECERTRRQSMSGFGLRGDRSSSRRSRHDGCPRRAVRSTAVVMFYPRFPNSPATRKVQSCRSNNQKPPVSYIRTPQHRRRQSEAIRRWRPWETVDADRRRLKAKRAHRATPTKGAGGEALRGLARTLRDQDRTGEPPDRMTANRRRIQPVNATH